MREARYAVPIERFPPYWPTPKTMSYDPRQQLLPRNTRERLEDALKDAGSDAKIVSPNDRDKTVVLSGDYADLVLANRALERVGLTRKDRP